MVKIDQLYKSFGTNEVLRGLSIHLGSRGITAVLGPNGSGKTTLIKCILGLVIPDRGMITFNDEDISGMYHYRNKIAHLPQIARFPENLTARELIKMIKDLRQGTTREEELIKIFSLRSELDKKMVNLSGGNRQKINLLLALMYECPLMILDEPSTGLDPISLIRLKEFLRNESKKGVGIIITTHIMDFVEQLADDIVFLLDGRIHFSGKLADLLDQQKEQKLEHAIASILSGAEE